jgi:hypothetical protein
VHVSHEADEQGRDGNEAMLSTASEELLRERLPWYVNDTLDHEARRWVDELVTRSAAASRLLLRERTMADMVIARVASAPQDIGLSRVRQLVRAEQGKPARPAAVEAPFRWIAGLRGALAALRHPLWPQLAATLAVVAVVQFGIIGWLVERPTANPGEVFRSLPVKEVRTLRVVFLATATEAQIRQALIAAGARIVGGPNQLGEYWLASPMDSVDEMRAILEKSGITRSIAVDTQGPR